jgi:hypothetical protein
MAFKCRSVGRPPPVIIHISSFEKVELNSVSILGASFNIFPAFFVKTPFFAYILSKGCAGREMSKQSIDI